MKSYLLFLLSMLLSFDISFAQVPKNVMVEHFTNTRCSICASKNPGFNMNLDNNPNIMRLSIHPSSPYPNCLLNNHNPTENDARTNYYGIYGSTPRIVIQGNVVSIGTNYSNSSIFNNYVGQTSPASIRIEQTKTSNSVMIKVIVKAEEVHSLGALRLFVALAEDTIFYNAPNGENRHYNVFREALTSASGDAFTLPAAVGDSVVLNFSASVSNDWDLSRIYAVAVLQEETSKSYVQVEAVPPTQNDMTTGIRYFESLDVHMYPNPTNGKVFIEGSTTDEIQATLYTLTGKAIGFFQNTLPMDIDISELSKGTYILRLESEKLTANKRVLKF